MIGMNFDGKPMTNIMEIGKSKGKKTGVVTSVPFCHATPAGFSTHSTSRSGFSQITYQMINSNTWMLLVAQVIHILITTEIQSIRQIQNISIPYLGII